MWIQLPEQDGISLVQSSHCRCEASEINKSKQAGKYLMFTELITVGEKKRKQGTVE